MADEDQLCLTSPIMMRIDLDSKVPVPIILTSVLLRDMQLTSKLDLEELDR